MGVIMSKARLSILRVALLLSVLAASAIMPSCSCTRPATPTGGGPETAVLEVHFIDVGQGDATLVMHGESAMLIDAGDASNGAAVREYIRGRGIEKLEYLVLTHPDSDHIGGAPPVISMYQVDRVFISNFEKDTMTYRKLIEALDAKRYAYATPGVGATHALGGAEFTILAPDGTYRDSNNSSIALLLTYGNTSFIFTGDAEERAERDIAANGHDISADVLHAGHHGSRTSSSAAFLDAVSPSFVVISCGTGNPYGHPHAETLERYRDMGMAVYRTDGQGSIVATSDGEAITWSVTPSGTWQAGGTATQEGRQATGDDPEDLAGQVTYVLNERSKVFHRPTCGSLPTANRKDSHESREEIIRQGYNACGRCNP